MFRKILAAAMAGVALLAAILTAQDSTLRARDLYYESLDESTQHLGLRHNLMQINPKTRESRAVDPDGTYRQGDCFALELTLNRSCHLYIFNRSSSGQWQALLPSPEMVEESNFVKGRTTVRIPREYCFEVSGKAGTETIMVAATDVLEEFERLNASFRNPKPASGDAAATPAAQTAAEVSQWRLQLLKGRELLIHKLARPPAQGEKQNSVYTMLASPRSGHIVVEVKIRHE